MENGVLHRTDKGTPQGGNLSSLLSNIMLNELDKEIESRRLNFVSLEHYLKVHTVI